MAYLKYQIKYLNLLNFLINGTSKCPDAYNQRYIFLFFLFARVVTKLSNYLRVRDL